MENKKILKKLLDQVQIVATTNKKLPNKYKEISIQKIKDLYVFFEDAYNTEAELLQYTIPSENLTYLDVIAENKLKRKRKSN